MSSGAQGNDQLRAVEPDRIRTAIYTQRDNFRLCFRIELDHKVSSETRFNFQIEFGIALPGTERGFVKHALDGYGLAADGLGLAKR